MLQSRDYLIKSREIVWIVFKVAFLKMLNYNKSILNISMEVHYEQSRNRLQDLWR
jgi:hypothetical protein